MRQPASVYLRSARRSAGRLRDRVLRRAQRLFACGAADSKPQRAARTVVSSADLGAALDAVGLASGASVMVHSGISGLGKVAGGPKAVYDLIRERVGEHGHVLYPVFPFGTLMHEYLKSGPGFDVRTAPSKMGALTEYALKIPGGLRSVHPTHSVLAFGKRAAEFVAEHHLCATPFAEGSPFERLARLGGKILLIGVGLNSTTSFHRVEDRLGERFPVRVYLPEVFRIACVDTQGDTVEVRTRAHDPFISRIRDCELVRQSFLQAGVMSVARVGDGEIALIDARAMDRTLEDCLSRGESIYGRIWG